MAQAGRIRYFLDIKRRFQTISTLLPIPKNMTITDFAVAKRSNRMPLLNCEDKTGWGHEITAFGQQQLRLMYV
jgi:hypothetical protein